MKVLYVTSFNKEIYEQSGKKMIESFIQTDDERNLLVCYEGMNFEEVEESSRNSRLISYSLHDDTFLSEWIAINLNLIPEIFGGKATPENSPQTFKYDFNMRASLFFRKVVSLKVAMEKFGESYDAIVWVDSDCVFNKKIPDAIFSKVFSKNIGCFYFLGAKRKVHKGRNNQGSGIETGFIGFYKNNGGYNILQDWINCYKDGSFKKMMRWDDGYVFKILHEKNKYPNSLDIASKSNMISVISDPKQVFFPYIVHFKGRHSKGFLKDKLINK